MSEGNRDMLPSFFSMDDLIDLIYGHPKGLRCGVCHRPLLVVKKDGKQHLFCKHCAGIAAEERCDQQ